MSIFLKDCPQCATSNPAEAVFCSCGYCFDPSRLHGSTDTLKFATHEERLYLEYLDARVAQAEAEFRAAEGRLARDPQNNSLAAEALLAQQSVNNARAERDVQWLKLRSLADRAKFARKRPKSGQPRPAALASVQSANSQTGQALRDMREAHSARLPLRSNEELAQRASARSPLPSGEGMGMREPGRNLSRQGEGMRVRAPAALASVPSAKPQPDRPGSAALASVPSAKPQPDRPGSAALASVPSANSQARKAHHEVHAAPTPAPELAAKAPVKAEIESASVPQRREPVAAEKTPPVTLADKPVSTVTAPVKPAEQPLAPLRPAAVVAAVKVAPAPVVAPTSATPKADTKPVAPRAPAPAITAKAGPAFQAAQAAKAAQVARAVSLAIAAPAPKPVAAATALRPTGTAPKLIPTSKDCPHCTASLPLDAKSCRCGFSFSSGAELPALTLSAEDKALFSDLSLTGNTRR
jgi:hypothetical protein